MMIFGRELNLPIDLALGKPVDEKSKFVTNYVIGLEETLTDVHEIAHENLGQTAINMKSSYDKGKFHNDYKPGDAVWFFNARRKKGLRSKLQNH